MTEKSKKYADEIVEEVGGGPLSPDVEAAIAEAIRLAEGGAPAPVPSTKQTPPPGRQVAPRETTLVPIGKLKDSPFQVRTEIDGDELQELADSIARKGVDTPIVAREKDGELQIVCGHRRVQALRRLHFNARTEDEREGYGVVPAFVVKGMSDKAMLTTGWIDNVLRANLSILDMAIGLLRIQEVNGLQTGDDVSNFTGLARMKVRRLLQLAHAPAVVQEGMSVGIEVPISAEELAEDDRPDNEKRREEHRKLGFTDALAFSRMHAQLLANAARGELPQKTADELTAKGIHQALASNWSSRQVNAFIARALGEPAAKASRKRTRSKGAFQSSKEKFVVYVRRISKLMPQEKKELRQALEPIWNAVKDA